MKTNFSHIISAESHTNAASWIVQLSSDSPDIIILLYPDQVHMKPEDEPSSDQLSSLTSDSQCIPAYSLYVVAAIALIAIVVALVVVFFVLYLYRRHISPRSHYQSQDNNDDAAFSLRGNYLLHEYQEIFRQPNVDEDNISFVSMQSTISN